MLLLLFSVFISTVWPSGLRRWLQAPVRKGMGSNPTAVIFGAHVHLLLCEVKYFLRARQMFSAQITSNLRMQLRRGAILSSLKGVVLKF